MNQAITRARRHQGGFTLIELLVVIIILGVLSAVVVFAVRGVGDKGKANAVATDERTIRTAEEAYCAKAGQYASMDQLTGQAPAADGNTYKFLSEASPYHGVTYPGGDLGNCNGQKYGLTIDPTVPTTTTTPQAPPVCPQPDSFCDIDSTPGTLSGREMVSLPNGRVLAFTRKYVSPGIYGFPVAEYDPTGTTEHPYGQWSVVADGPPRDRVGSNQGGPRQALLIRSRPGQDDCSANCGKVLVHYATGSWWLYNPEDASWSQVSAPSSDPGDTGTENGNGTAVSMAQILGDGNGCGSFCGQVLIVYARGPGFVGGNFAELWDPKGGVPGGTGTFRPLGYMEQQPGLQSFSDAPMMEALSDGRVMVAASGLKPGPKWTQFFNPQTFATTGFDSGPPHAYAADNYTSWTVLDNGDGLWVTGSGAEVFSSGAWTTVPSCSGHCQVLSAFTGGGALAVSPGWSEPGYNPVTWRYSSGTRRWQMVNGQLPNIATVSRIALGAHIPGGQVVIAAGYGQASALYNPPAP